MRFRINPFIVFETPEAPGQAPPAAVVPETTPPPAAEPTGPWSADLVEYFGEDAEAIAKADRYMREKHQPYITELESHPGRELWKDITEDAETTLAEVVGELYGDEKAAQFRAIFGEEATVAEAVAATTEPGDAVPEWAKPLIAREQAVADREAREASEADYAAVLAEMRADHTDLRDEDMELIHPFISAAGGDLEQAYRGYRTFTEQHLAAHGVTPADAAAAEAEQPPPVLGTQGAPAAAPPVAKKYGSLDDAMDDFLSEQRQQAPPPVI